ncbi:MAG: hypothetical protein KZQ75_09135 [Candidatus Thiodiazotropha sp. (ex Myrtea spinifera)]|nr:hypothetical protein [Candidatus Thiodiazotropha sp. (ex Myrtea spinifera)]MCU7829458.1 hypothetical protein [Candidatus Thiodiazotropha sp. (ex Myrtea sp. 'scaly one' KF741663)]
MKQLTDHEYRQLEHFKNIARYRPSDLLMRYKRNVILFGSFVVFYHFAEIHIEGFSGGFIKGTIGHPELVPLFLALFFIYNIYMFDLYIRKELDFHDFQVNDIRTFGVAISRYIIKQEIGKFVQSDRPDNEYEPKNYSLVSKSAVDEIKVQFTLDPEIRKAHDSEIEKLDGFTLDTHTINYNYKLTDHDKKFYEDNRGFLTNLLIHEFMEFKFPKIFGGTVLILIFYISISNLTSG